MTNCDIMAQAILNGDCDDATVSAYLDALREEHGYSLIAAVGVVAGARQEYLDAKDVRDARQLLDEATGWSEAILDALASELGREAFLPSDIEIQPGDDGPEIVQVHVPGVVPEYPDEIITVGAVWILDLIEDMIDDARRDKYRHDDG